jgi:hypothetical protein
MDRNYLRDAGIERLGAARRHVQILEGVCKKFEIAIAAPCTRRASVRTR